MKKTAFIFISTGLIMAILHGSQIEFRNKIGIWSADGGILLIGTTLLTLNWIINQFRKEDMKFWEIIFPFSLFGICTLLLILSFRIGNTIKEDVLTYSNGKVNLIVQRFETGVTGNEQFRCIIEKKAILSLRLMEEIQMPNEINGIKKIDLNSAPFSITVDKEVYKKIK